MNSKEWYDKNRSYALNHKRMYRVDNYEKLREMERQNHIKHRERRNAVSLAYYYKNRTRLLDYYKKKYHEKKEKLKN